MTAYEIVSTILVVVSLMVAAGMFVLALLTFLQKRKKRKSDLPKDVLKNR